MTHESRKSKKKVTETTNRLEPQVHDKPAHAVNISAIEWTDNKAEWSNVWQVVIAALAAGFLTIIELCVWAKVHEIPKVSEELLAHFHPWLQHHVIGHEMDRELYLIGLLAFPIQLILIASGLNKIDLRLNLGREFMAFWIPTWVALLFAAFLWLNYLANWRYLILPGASFYPALEWRMLWTLLFFSSIAIACWQYRKASSNQHSVLKGLVWIGATLMLGLIFFFQWFNEYKLFAGINPHHFNSIFDANVQLYLGRPLSCRGLTHQYGLYPYFIEPIFQFTGLSVSGFSLVMQSLQVAAYGLLLLGAVRYFTNLFWAVGTWFIVVYFIYFQDSIHGQNLDIVYQVMPVRILFPFLLIGMLPRTELVTGPRWWIAQALLGLAPFWNLDTGIIVWLTWQATVWWQCVADSGWRRVHHGLLRALTISVVGLIFIVLEYFGFCGYVRLRFGEWPSLSDGMVFQQIFYKSGFMMLPMPLWHPWLISMATYGVGLTIAVYGLLAGRSSYWFRTTFGLSILGCGFFSFYNGRSHEVVFSWTTYAAILLAGAFSEQAVLYFIQQSSKRSRRAAISIAGTFVFTISFCMSCLVCEQAIITEWIARLWNPAVRMPYVDEEHLLLKKWGETYKGLCILSFNRSSTLTLAASSPSPVPASSLTESILVEQFQLFLDYLNEPGRKYVVVDYVDDVLKTSPPLRATLAELNPTLIEASPSQSIGLYEVGRTTDVMKSPAGL